MPRVRTQDDNGSKENIEYVSTSAGAADADKFVRTSANGKLDPSVVDLSGAGLTMTSNVLAAVTAGQAIAKQSITGQDRLILANATDATKPCIGFVQEDQATPGGAVNWLPLVGEVPVVSATTANTDYFLDVNDGAIVVATAVSAFVTGNGIQKIGKTSIAGLLHCISEDIEIIA